MAQACHICGSTVKEDGSLTDGGKDGFVCADCGEWTCNDCKSFGLSRETDHCQYCRG